MPLRPFVRLLSFCGAGMLFLHPSFAQDDPFVTYGPPEPFSYEKLIEEARALSTKEYAEPEVPDRALLHKLNFNQHVRISYKKDALVWVGAKREFAITFFHVGLYFMYPVEINIVEKDKARRLTVSRNAFNIPDDSPAVQMLSDQRVAGFKIQEDKFGKLDWQTNDWASFLGAAYFRTIGELFQYGLSARGIAVNPANPNPPFNEEFPRFSKFWIDENSNSPTGLTIYALMEGPSITGAYRFDFERRKNVITDVEATIFLRRDIARLGFAPLTSMYWFSETAKPAILDWRPEVHDSDGLAIAGGNGERIWRPLNNPPRIRLSSFVENNPRGFGLMQRDRDWHNYVEDGAYERRPSLWVDIKEDWGKGFIQLLELPTDDESEDNIVAFWVPEAPAKAGQMFHLKYRLNWTGIEPGYPDLGRCTATRLVREPMKHWPENEQKFIVEFQGGPLDKLPSRDSGLQTDLWASRGRIQDVIIEPLSVDGKPLWRIKFTLADFAGPDPVEMRLVLKKDDKALTETWLYQFNP